MGEHMHALGHSPACQLNVELGLVAAELTDSAVLSDQSLARMLDLIGRFGRFVDRGFDVRCLDEVTAAHVRGFVRSRGRDRVEPRVGTMHLRRSAVRLLFRTARGLGIATGDPTVDLMLDARSGVVGRPLSDDEVGVCRSAALQSLTSTRLSAAWALAEATARTAELPHDLSAYRALTTV